MEVNCPELCFVQQYYTRANDPPYAGLYADYTRRPRKQGFCKFCIEFTSFLHSSSLLRLWIMCAHCQMPIARQPSPPITRNPPTSRMALWPDLAQSVQITIRAVYAASVWKTWPSLLKGPNHKKQWCGASHKLRSSTCIYLQWFGAFWKVLNEWYSHTWIV